MKAVHYEDCHPVDQSQNIATLHLCIRAKLYNGKTDSRETISTYICVSMRSCIMVKLIQGRKFLLTPVYSCEVAQWQN